MTIALAVVVMAAVFVVGCQSPNEAPVQDDSILSAATVNLWRSSLTPQQIQSQVMGFADTFTNRYAQAADELEQSLTDANRRAGIHDAKIDSVLAAFSIAASQSSIVSLLDMTVFIMLQRIIYEEYWQPRLPIGAEGDQMLVAMYASEEEIWEIAAQVLTDEQRSELRSIILHWRNQNPTQNYVSRIRLSEFATMRTTADTETGTGRQGSILSLLALDPLASLDPTTRELQRTRLSAERVAWFAKRLPVVLAWYPKQAAYDIAATPEMSELLERVDGFEASTADLAESVRAWPEIIAAEREALMAGTDELIATASATLAADLQDVLEAEREAALEQLAATVRTERESFQNWIDGEHEELSSLLVETRNTMAAGDALAQSTRNLLETYERLNPPRDPSTEPRETDPTTIADYERTLVQAESTARELRELTESIRGVLEADDGGNEPTGITRTLTAAQTGAESIVDRAFRYGIILIGLLLVGLPVSIAVAMRLRRRA